MALRLTERILRYAGGLSITGPIFGKELRVSSRRKRNYILRSVYLVLLILFVVLVWSRAVRSGSQAYNVDQMSEAGRSIIVTLIWFEFIAAQVIAVIMLSSAINEERYRRTLGVLMTTPISSLQIVMGKLLSKLLQLIILLAVSVPVLAVVRVFGGVQWNFVVAGMCITFTAALFAASVSLLFSIVFRRAYLTILVTLGVGLCYYALLPWMVGKMIGLENIEWFMRVMFHLNPYAVLMLSTIQLLSPAFAPSLGFTMYWQVHCGTMLGISACILAVCVLLVRRVARRQVSGEGGGGRIVPIPAAPPADMLVQNAPSEGVPVPPPLPAMAPAAAPTGRIRSVRGSPVVWKERRIPMLGGIGRIIALTIGVVILLLTYALFNDDLADEDVQGVYAMVLVLVATVTTAVLSATSITSEKEARSWPILLATTLNDSEILWGKAVGVIRRCSPVWLILFGHLIIFTVVGVLHPVVLLHVGMLMAWVITFLIGSGLYFSASLRRTTAAVLANLGLVATIWLIVPVVLGMADADGRSIEYYIGANPVIQAWVLVAGAADGSDLDDLDYSWPRGGRGVERTSRYMATYAGVYLTIGAVFALVAWTRIRKQVF